MPTSIDPDMCSQAAELICGGMIWCETTEGHEFWAEVHRRLCAYANYDHPIHTRPTIEEILP